MQLQELIVLAIAVEGLVELLYGAEILRGPRDWLKRRSVFFKRLLECKYCLSVWAAALVAGLWALARFVHPAASWMIWTIALHRTANRLHDLFDYVVQAKVQFYWTRKVEGGMNDGRN